MLEEEGGGFKITKRIGHLLVSGLRTASASAEGRDAMHVICMIRAGGGGV